MAAAINESFLFANSSSSSPPILPVESATGAVHRSPSSITDALLATGGRSMVLPKREEFESWELSSGGVSAGASTSMFHHHQSATANISSTSNFTLNGHHINSTVAHADSGRIPNKQAPVWNYFTYTKLENLSRCRVGNCTYMLKGPHTSTLACHLKKHPIEYLQFQKLKGEYLKEKCHRFQTDIDGRTTSTSSSSAMCSSTMSKKLTVALATPTNHHRASAYSSSPARSRIRRNRSSRATISTVRLPPPPPPTTNQFVPQLLFNNNKRPSINHPHTFKISSNSSGASKWLHTDARQSTLDTKLALMFAAVHLPLSLIGNEYVRDFIATAQPQFTMPSTIAELDATIAQLHRDQLSIIRELIANAKHIAIAIDVLKLPLYDGHIYLCVTASMRSQNDRMQVILLAIRKVINHNGHSVSRLSVRECIDQVLYEYDIPVSKISRFVTCGLGDVISSGAIAPNNYEHETFNDAFHNGHRTTTDEETLKNLFPRHLDAYNQKLMHSLLTVIDGNDGVDRLKKATYEMVLQFTGNAAAVDAHQRLIGKPLSLSTKCSFLLLIDALIDIKPTFIAVARDQNIACVDESDWSQLESISQLLRLFKTHMNVVQIDGSYATIDTVVPSLMQLELSLDKEFTNLDPLPQQLKVDLLTRSASILDVNAVDFDSTYVVATILNPQLALLLNDEQFEFAKQQLICMLSDQMKLDASVKSSSSTTTHSSSINGSLAVLYPDLIELAAHRRRHSSIADRNRLLNAQTSRYATAIVESYLDDLPNYDASQLALSFWSSHNAIKCGHLADIAQSLLTVPASTASIERIFNLVDDDDQQQQQQQLYDLIKDEQNIERNTMIRFNRQLMMMKSI